MKNYFKFCCEDMRVNIEENSVIYFSKIFREFGLNLKEDQLSYILINYCPWCGKKLPDSKREEWFEELEKLGFDTPLFNEDIPFKYKTDEWWNK